MAGRSSSSSPWASGSFYLVALVVIALTLIVAAKTVPAWAIPLVFLAMILLLTIIGAFVLRSMPGFGNKSFLKLMGMVFTQVPLILGRKKDAGKDQDGGQGDDQPDS